MGKHSAKKKARRQVRQTKQGGGMRTSLAAPVQSGMLLTMPGESLTLMPGEQIIDRDPRDVREVLLWDTPIEECTPAVQAYVAEVEALASRLEDRGWTFCSAESGIGSANWGYPPSEYEPEHYLIESRTSLALELAEATCLAEAMTEVVLVGTSLEFGWWRPENVNSLLGHLDAVEAHRAGDDPRRIPLPYETRGADQPVDAELLATGYTDSMRRK